jgi:hypothetical protein
MNNIPLHTSDTQGQAGYRREAENNFLWHKIRETAQTNQTGSEKYS